MPDRAVTDRSATSREIWDEMRRLRSLLEDRNALCGNCGLLIESSVTHAPQGMGWCVIGTSHGGIEP